MEIFNKIILCTSLEFLFLHISILITFAHKNICLDLQIYFSNTRCFLLDKQIYILFIWLSILII